MNSINFELYFFDFSQLIEFLVDFLKREFDLKFDFRLFYLDFKLYLCTDFYFNCNLIFLIFNLIWEQIKNSLNIQDFFLFVEKLQISEIEHFKANFYFLNEKLGEFKTPRNNEIKISKKKFSEISILSMKLNKLRFI